MAIVDELHAHARRDLYDLHDPTPVRIEKSPPSSARYASGASNRGARSSVWSTTRSTGTSWTCRSSRPSRRPGGATKPGTAERCHAPGAPLGARTTDAAGYVRARGCPCTQPQGGGRRAPPGLGVEISCLQRAAPDLGFFQKPRGTAALPRRSAGRSPRSPAPSPTPAARRLRGPPPRSCSAPPGDLLVMRRGEYPVHLLNHRRGTVHSVRPMRADLHDGERPIAKFANLIDSES